MQALSNQSTPQNEHYQDVGLHTEFEQYQNEHLQNEQYPNIIGYEPAGLTVHPPPRMIVGGFIFFVWVSSATKIFSSKKIDFVGDIKSSSL